MHRDWLGGIVVASMCLPCTIPRPARACGSYFVDEKRQRIFIDEKKQSEAIDVATREIDGEHADTALAVIVAGYPRLRAFYASAEAPGTLVRVMRGAALALARSDGAIGARVSAFPSKTPQERTSNVAWALATMEALSATRPNDPAIQADLGEVMSHVPPRRAQAAALLDALAAKDLLGSAHAYAALATLRAASGDASGAADARVRCAAMTRAPEAVCGVPRAGEPGV